MGARKAKRRKIARKVIREVVHHSADVTYCGPLTSHLSDREFDALVREIRKARVTVKWRR